MSIDPSLTVAERLALVRLAQASGLKRSSAELPAIERVDRAGPLPLSFAQARLWFLEQLGGLGSTYHIPGRLRLRGPLDRGALVRALDRLVERHEALRTTIAVRDGEPEQRIGPESSRFPLVEHDLAGEPEEALARVSAEEAAAPFDLERGPLIRGRLIRLAEDDHVLLLAMHHIVADGWSMGVLVDELSALYAAFREGRPDPLPPLPVQYADYAAWQRRWVEGRVLEAQAGYWTRTLAGAPALLELPTDHPRPSQQDHAGARLPIELDETLTAGLKELGRRHGATPFMTLLAGWAAVLARLSGQEAVVIGMPTANRGRGEVEGLIGFFVNTLALRVDLPPRLTVAGLLEQVKRRALEAQTHQDIPFEQVVERVDPVRTLAHTPLFQVMFAWQNPRSGAGLPGLEPGGAAEAGGAPGAERTTAKFDLSLTLSEAGGRIVGGLTYATSLFERETVERHLGYLRRVLEQMAADDRRAVDRLELLPEAERHRVVEACNRTEAAYPAELCVHELFEAQVARTPDAVAVVFEDGALSYAELNRRANRLAHHLRERGVGPEARVGLCLERGPDAVVGVLGVLKAGGAWVPLDPAYPAERLRYVLEDSAPGIVLTQASIAAAADGPFAGLGLEVLALDAPRWEHQPGTDPPRGALVPANLAYVIYTSGSTGRPKGVMVPHRGVVNLIHWMSARWELDGRGALLHKAPLGFDASVWEVIWPLATGARLVVARPQGQKDAGYLAEVIRRERITAMSFIPSMLEMLLGHPDADRCTSLRWAMCGGEALPAALVHRLRERLPAAEPSNRYGPTEATNAVAAWWCGPGERGTHAPIGHPIHNTRIYLLDGTGAPVPVGVVGELYVGGVQVVRGYQGRPGLTAERFVADPFAGEPGARLYRTGDLGRRRPDGAIEFVGRNDFQVKVRGFRIELGEIEARLSEHDAVREAAVAARTEGPGGPRLVAYWVGSRPVEAEALRAHLGERLPEHMVPAAYVRLEALPLTPSGKLDRRALPSPEGDAYTRRAYEAPRGEVEQALAEIWSELLGVAEVGRRDHFFELGGHSLLVMRVVSRVREVMGAQVELGVVFQRPVLSELAEAVAAAGRAELPPIERADRSAPLPLSYAQARLWFLEQMGGLGSAYHTSKRLRLRGALDREALARALDRLLARHESLRTTFRSRNGDPEQRIAPVEESAFVLVEHDLAGEAPEALQRVMAEESAAPFDLERGPLVRGRLARLDTDDYVLLLTMHHIVSDGWSAGVLIDELSRLYGAFRAGVADPLPPLPIQYADYAAWQRRWVEDEVLEAQASYWRERLAGVPALLELPADRPRPPRQDHAGAGVRVVLDEPLTAGLKALSRRHGTTLFMTLLAGWAAVLGRLSGQRDVVVGTPTANRGRRELEGLIGFFVNTLALRVELDGRPTVAGLLEQVKRRALEAQQNQDIPFEQVVELLDPVRTLSHSPLFQVLFTWQNTPRGSVALPGLALSGLPGAERTTAKFDLSLTLAEAGGRVAGGLTYATALFEQATVERHVGYLRRVLEQMAADDRQPVHRLAILAEAERRRVVEEWNADRFEFPRDTCAHELFEAQVERTPDAVAVVFEDGALSYAALNRRANRLAHRLRARGVGPDARVGVCVERSLEMVVGVLAVLKAGGAWVPLDPALPAERLRYLLEDSGAALVLARGASAGALAEVDVPVLDVGDRAADAGPETNPERAGPPPSHLAYVIYTSGSTGEPKGVMVAHGGVVNLVQWMKQRWPMDAGHALLQKTPLGFDVSVWELLWPLASGARLVVARPEGHKDPAYLAEVIRSERITAVSFVPSMLDVFLAHPDVEGCTSLRWVMSGGEALPGALARRLHERLPAAELYNRYAPTEATVNAVAWRCDPGEADTPIPIGRPRANVPLYILDAEGGPVPVGVVGELFIGGVQVARGYQGRPGLSAERFVPDPYGREPGARLYRTGDLARWRADGAVELVGRGDFQVKLRGIRIEPGEIEARLREHPAVREAVVLPREDGPGGRRLVAYVVGPYAVAADAMRAYLSERLPEHMVPAAFVRLQAFPLTPSGKVDRRALPAPEGDAFATRGYEAPASEMEQALAEVWSEVLGAERVGRRDHFFELGGHSLLAVRVISRVRQVLGAEAAIADLFERPVLADFARGVEQSGRADLPPIEPVERSGALPLSFAQARLWFLDHMEGAGAAYHIPTRLRLHGEMDGVALARALDRIVARHEALRTTFPVSDGVPSQRIAPAEENRLHLAAHDLEGNPGADSELRRLVAEEARAPFDLARGPLVRGRLIRLAEDDHVLLITMHHIVSDAWSKGVFAREVSALYDAFRRGEPDPLLPLPVQYADYAAWQRRWVAGEVLQAQAEYWRRTLAGAPELLELPTDRPRPARQDHAGASAGIDLGEALATELRALAKRHATTLFMTLLAGWAVVLGRLSGQGDVVVGTPSANRQRKEIEGLIGFFVNTLALRVELGGSPSVSDLLRRVKERALEAQANQDIPFEQVVELVQPSRTLAYAPLVQVMFSWQGASQGGARLGGLTAAPVERSSGATAKFDLSLSLGEAGGRIGGRLTYATALFERDTAERWLGYLRRVLEGMAADDRQAVGALPLLSDAERRRVVEEWNRTGAAYPSERVHERFAAQAARTPEAVAVVSGEERLTYAELDARSNRLARHLGALGVGPDARVGLLLERSADAVVGVLAVLKAGGAYVALDPSYPDERLHFMLRDAGARALLTQAALEGRLAGWGGATVRLDADAETIASESAAAPAVRVAAESLAYVIYTSGSTGEPKGVLIEHGGLSNYLAFFDREILGEGFALPMVSRLSFDAHVRQLYPPLLRGEAVWVLPEEVVTDPAAILEALASRERVSFGGVPSLWSAVLDQAESGAHALPGDLCAVLLGGEALPPALVRRTLARFPGARIWNHYGPTEATVNTTVARVEDAERVTLGRPIANVRVYLLDAHGNPVPAGVAGELYVGGAGVSRGYLGRPALTAEKYLPDPFGAEPGGRVYRSGDRVRWLADGELEYLGRVDHQVKVRGFRVELGEIEARLRRHAEVRDAVVVAREDAPGDRRLVAYYAGGAVEAEALRAHLATSLPEHMVPTAYVRLEALPLTPNGKVDRRALPAPEGDAFATRGFEAPLGEGEEALAGIWSDVLGIDRIGRRDHFFELGGHSLLAVQVISRVRQTLGVQAALGDVFLRPVLADFARGLEQAGRAELPPIEPAERTGRLPLSFAQARLWFLEQMGGMGSTYHIPKRLRLRGALDADALRRALERIVARHEALRTTFHAAGGEPEQRIAEQGRFHLLEHDLSAHPDAAAELGRLADEEAHAPFDLERGPLVRGRLVRLAEDDHVLLLTMHHIVSDGWSSGVLTNELSALYGAFRAGRPDPLPPLAVQYADYAAWQRTWVDGEVLREQAEYWERTLAGAPELLELPTDRPRPARQDHAGAVLGIDLGAELSAGLRALSQRHGATLHMTLLAGWAAVLGRLSGQEDVVVGTPTANRGRTEIEGLIGFFVNTLALRVELRGSPSVAELLGRVRERALEAQHHQDIPFEQVVERVQPARSLGHAPLFQVMFAWQNAARGGLELPGLSLGSAGAAGAAGSGGSASVAAAKFDLSLSLSERDGRVAGSVTYATALFERATVERHVGYFRRLLEAMTADERQPVDSLELLSERERRQVVEEWNRTEAPYPGESCVHELFEAQAERAPGAVAVVFEDRSLTYAELNARANRLAHHLRALGVGPDARVAVCLERSVEMVVALLAALKAGGAYVPLDPEYPVERLRHMLRDSAPAVLLAHAATAPIAEGAGVPVLDVAEPERWATSSPENPARAGLSPDHLAYVIYTSGSTGLPKGVMVPHRGLTHYVWWARSRYLEGEPLDLPLYSSIAFDLTVTSVYTPLIAGGAIVVHREGGPGDIPVLRVIDEGSADVLKLTPAHLALLRSREPGTARTRTLIVGGEALTTAAARSALGAFGGGVEIYNEYGPTEAVVGCMVHRFDARVDRGAAVPIGRPIANTRVYVLDRRGLPVPIEVVGELHVGGVQVTRGYLERPALTAERFVPDPFGGASGARLYRTGDLARWRADGTMEYLGRNDTQVKVRGFRIEPGEIEARLREHEGIREAVVVAREEVPGNTRLVAYYVGEAGEAEALRSSLSKHLPEHMLPAAYVRLEALPLTLNGKLDRAALPAPEGDAFARRGWEAPAGETETALAEIWAELLGVERVGRGDNFFELGGHSLLVVQLVERMRRRGLHASVHALFVAPTLAELAAQVGGAAGDVEVPANLIPGPEPGAGDEAEEVEFVL